jgi:DNA-binding transcriptional LysR family regulator
MLDRLEALQALSTAGTMGRAAAALRITQSAVSKRIGALQAELGVTLIERQGRRVRLTPEAERVLAQARPLLLRLREVLASQSPKSPKTKQALRIAATDSLLASWLPAALRSALDRLPGLAIELHAHRGPVLLERVRSGDYALGLCPAGAGDPELRQRELLQEPMVIVPSGLQPLRPQGVVEVWSIEPRSLTWEAIGGRLARIQRHAGYAIEVTGRLESFAALVQVARAGFAHALVPGGVARELGVPSNRLVRVPGLHRTIAAVGRKTVLDTAPVRALLAALARSLQPED